MNRILGLLFLSFTLPVFSAPELKGTPSELKQFLHPADKLITITEQAEKTAYADQAIVSLVVTTEKKALSAAMNENSKLRTAISKRLIDAGIKASDINSSKFSSSPEYGWFGDEPKSHKVINRVAILIRDEAQLNQLANIADDYNEAVLSKSVFKHSKKDEYKQEVKRLALEKVLAQKAFYETTLGLKLVPISVHEIMNSEAATAGAEELEMFVVGARMASDSKSVRTRQPQTQDSFEEVKYSSSVQVQFRIVE